MARCLPTHELSKHDAVRLATTRVVVPRSVSMLFNLTLIIAFLVLAAFLHITLLLLEPIDRSRQRE
jgi:hypothetical protein